MKITNIIMIAAAAMIAITSSSVTAEQSASDKATEKAAKQALQGSRTSADQTVNIDTLNVETLNIQSNEQNSPEITFHATEVLKKSGTPFSNVVEVDGWIFLAGMLGTKPGVGVVPGGIVPETRQAMERIKATLAEHGVSMNRVVKCLVILADFDDFRAFNEVYKTFFNGQYPARSTFAAKTLAANARVEIECTARR